MESRRVLTEDLFSARKVDRSLRKISRPHSKLKKGLLAECKVDLRQLPVHPRDLPSTSVRDLLSTSVNFPYGRETFCQLPSIFLATRIFFDNFHHISMLPEDLSSTLYEARRTSVNFRQLSVPSGDPPSNFVKFLCSRPSVNVP